MSLEISNFDPAPSLGIGSGSPLRFDVTGTGSYAITVEIDGVRQLAWTGTAFAIPFAGQSSRSAISGGYRYTLRRNDNRWPAYPSILLQPLEGGGGGDAGTVTPDADELLLRDGTAQAWATAFVGKSTESWKAKSDTANYAFAEATGVSFPVTLVCSTGQSDIYCTGSTGFRTRAVEHTFSARSTDAITGSVTVQSTATEMVVAAKGAAKPLVMRQTSSTAGIDLDLAAEGQKVAIQVADVDALTVTPTAGTVTVAGGTGRDVTHTTAAGEVWSVSAGQVRVNHETGNATLLREAGVTYATLSSAAGSVIDANGTYLRLGSSEANEAELYGSNEAKLISDAAVVLEVDTVSATCTDSSGTFLCATNAPMRIQPQQQTSGAGRDLTIGGGAGQTPGTHAPGDVVVDLGTRVGNTGGRMEFFDGGTLLGTINAGPTLANFMTVSQDRINSGLRLSAEQSGSGVTVIGSQGVTLQGVSATSPVVLQGAIHRRQTQGSLLFEETRAASATIASATTTSVVTFATTSNRRYQVFGILTVSNDTDNEGADYWVRASFKNVAGTVTQIGATQTIAADLEDAGQTGLSAVLDFSGTDIRLRLITDAADTVNVNGVLALYERILA